MLYFCLSLIPVFIIWLLPFDYHYKFTLHAAAPCLKNHKPIFEPGGLLLGLNDPDLKFHATDDIVYTVEHAYYIMALHTVSSVLIFNIMVAK